jgi:hypothetical protein
MRKENTFFGVLFILIGCALLFTNYVLKIQIFDFSQNDFWPFIVLGVGIIFEMSYFLSHKAPGLLVPGGIISVCGLLFIFEVATNWKFAAYTWPVYIFAVAFGLFQLYLFGSRRKGLLIAASLVLLASGFGVVISIFESFSYWSDLGSIVIAGFLIIVGLVVVFGKGKKASV